MPAGAHLPGGRPSRDYRLILTAEALRAFGYAFGALLLGSSLAHLRFSAFEAGAVLAAIIAGSAFSSAGVARFSDRVGRRRSYVLLYLLLAGVATGFAFLRSPWALGALGLTGVLSVEVSGAGAFGSLEQAMIATVAPAGKHTSRFGAYHALATAAGALGALAIALPAAVHRVWHGAPGEQRYFLLLAGVALAGAAIGIALSSASEAAPERGASPPGLLDRSRPVVSRLASLFAIDAFAGGLVLQAFIAFWLVRTFGASTTDLGALFLGVGALQTVSMLLAAPLARRFGLLETMVFSHLPSNLMLVAIGFAPAFWVAAALLLAHATLSRMDVPTRQAYLMALVDPSERTAASGYTNAARAATRPFGTLLSGALLGAAQGAPFAAAGVLKSAYDMVVWRWFRKVELPEHQS
ncbi:MAG: MFS transporter [Acidimicrobiales bacterium]|nr:MFS transporter [Actinomycetota bacterium]